MAHAGLRREVAHARAGPEPSASNAAPSTLGRAGRRGSPVALALDQLGVAVLLELRIVVGREGVEADHLVAAVEQRLAGWNPMNPAAPVTSTFIEHLVRKGRGLRGWGRSTSPGEEEERIFSRVRQ